MLAFSNQVRCSLRDLDLVLPGIAEKPGTKPFWLQSRPDVEFLFNEKKTDIFPKEIQAIFNEFKANNADNIFLYTDGSKIDNRVGMAVAGRDMELCTLLPDKTSIFTAQGNGPSDRCPTVS